VTISKTLVVRGASDKMIAFGIIEPHNEFWLEPVEVAGIPILYTVRFERGKMPQHWTNVRLVPAGTTAYPLAVPLPDMQKPPQKIYSDLCGDIDKALIGDKTGEFTRLEGVLTVDGQPHVVIFFNFSGAQQNGRDWVFMQVRTTDDETARARQNGTAHGDPK
jgi:hypothetical protein